MSVFRRDLPPPVVNEVPTDGDWVAVFSARITEYLRARNASPRDVEVPAVRIAGALLGAVPLKHAVAQVLAAMSYPAAPCDYEASSPELAEFAAVLNDACKKVYAYAEDCWVARRVLLLDWIRRADDVVPNSEEWDAAMAEVSVVVAEAEGSELRLTIFEQGIKDAVQSCERAVTYGVEPPRTITERISELTRDVAAAGVRYSAPSMGVCVDY